MLFERTFEELIAQSLNEMAQTTRITNLSPGSKARTFLEIVSRKLNEAYQVFDLNLARAFVSGANGQFLDFIGELVGLTRFTPEPSKASAESKTLRFYVETGTFGDINSGADILVPAGTIISSSDGSAVKYRLTSSALLSSSLSEQYVDVEGVNPGTVNNVGVGTLVTHNFIAYTDAANETLLVTNPAGIFNGRDLESDANFRFRIVNQVTAAEAANRTAIRLAALSVPGVADVLDIPYSRGIGTYDLLVKSITPTVSDSLLEAVQATIDAVTAFGLIGLARKPVEVGITFTISVRYRTSLDTETINSIQDAIRQSLTNYVNGLDIGEEFIINEAVQRVMETDDRIKDIGVPTKPFDELIIYRPTKLEDNKIKQNLLKNYITAADERVVIEPSVSEPITINTVS